MEIEGRLAMLNLLYQLQLLDIEAKKIDEEQKSSGVGRELRDIKTSFEQDKKEWLNGEEKSKHLSCGIRDAELSIEELQAKAEKEKVTIYDGSIRNTRELSAKEQQLENLEKNIETQVAEKDSLQNKLSSLQQRNQELKEQMESKYTKFNSLKSSGREDRAKSEQRLEEINAKIADLRKNIPVKFLDWYERNKEKFTGQPLAFLDNDHVCSGCHTTQPPVVAKRTAEGKIDTFCEKCGRKLFILANG